MSAGLHLGLNHGQTVRAHFRHHPQNIHKLVFSDVLHQTVQSDEGSRPADSSTAHKPRSFVTELQRPNTAGEFPDEGQHSSPVVI